MDKYGFKLTVESRQGVTSGTETAESLSSFVAESLGFIPARGKGLVAVRIVELMSRIAGKRDTTIKTK
ncbi:MAG: hypothetical protein GOV15_03095, partial [Candidatus Diapherotrites archaeon]|nr:hypothetical protein [Candidatus Diapherotrites archaeon]